MTLTRSVAPPHPAGIDPTVTDATFDPDRFCSTVRPVFVQRAVVAVPAPMDPLEKESDAANATAAPIATQTAAAQTTTRSQRIAVSASYLVALGGTIR
jgi:hypothetical protein